MSKGTSTHSTDREGKFPPTELARLDVAILIGNDYIYKNIPCCDIYFAKGQFKIGGGNPTFHRSEFRCAALRPKVGFGCDGHRPNS